MLHVHDDLSLAIAPFGHDAAEHAGYDLELAIHAPPPLYPVLHAHDDLSLAIEPFGHDTAEHAGYDVELVIHAPPPL